jgi:hypothetical protein
MLGSNILLLQRSQSVFPSAWGTECHTLIQKDRHRADWYSGNTVFWRCLDLISAGTRAILTEVFNGFTQSFQKNAGKLPRLDHNRFLPDLCNSLFINNPITRHFVTFRNILVENPEGRRPLGRPRRRWVVNIKIGLREIEWGGMDWIDLAEDRDQ